MADLAELATDDAPLSFREFIALVNPRYQFYRHCDELIDVLQLVADDLLHRVMVFEPPRHGKSELVSRLFPAYYLYRHPERFVGIASYGASNCSPANSMPLEDLVQYQVTESLARFHLEVAVNDLVTWAFPLAQRVQADVARQLGGRSASIRAAAAAQLVRDQRALDAQRAAIDKIIMSADRSLSAHVAPPSLPS